MIFPLLPFSPESSSVVFFLLLPHYPNSSSLFPATNMLLHSIVNSIYLTYSFHLAQRIHLFLKHLLLLTFKEQFSSGLLPIPLPFLCWFLQISLPLNAYASRCITWRIHLILWILMPCKEWRFPNFSLKFWFYMSTCHSGCPPGCLTAITN